ncbi:phosphatidic acid phosphatase type 2/haloperoxidase [Stachybotrys elegans]|uniref:Phosphatidic acid phosphatase type 2/haloperoxidase n=1 Tax=Stachybotrys elegans TaxID=80388 RepID=A0A8K0WRR0_9HYPO|nr:phosphatidic acid phosphatase type 2/haloperoxidase [Stachybotrys elegans]
MASPRDKIMTQHHRSASMKVILSYVSHWLILIIVGIVSYIFDTLEPRKRPFAITDPSISFPYNESDTVPLWLLGILVGAVPFFLILTITFILVPGSTVPRHTPARLIWRRKLWEFHAGTLGFATAHVIAFFFTQGMKNLFGRPRPDLLDRCQPDVGNASLYIVGGFAGQSQDRQFYSPSICQQDDSSVLDDGFRSFPSGHSSASTAGLIYLCLFLANSGVSFPASSKPVYGRRPENATKVQSLRNQAAAPPLYLVTIALAPLALSIYISASRWFDFRHHGFDILFGYFIGLLAALYSFRCYHTPISRGAGWAWGPRSNDYAFWAGVGGTGYKTLSAEGGVSEWAGKDHGMPRQSQEPENNNGSSGRSRPQLSAQSSSASHVPCVAGNLDPYFDVEMQRIDNEPRSFDHRV